MYEICTSTKIMLENALFLEEKKFHSLHKFYTTASRDGRDKSQNWPQYTNKNKKSDKDENLYQAGHKI